MTCGDIDTHLQHIKPGLIIQELFSHDANARGPTEMKFMTAWGELLFVGSRNSKGVCLGSNGEYLEGDSDVICTLALDRRAKVRLGPFMSRSMIHGNKVMPQCGRRPSPPPPCVDVLHYRIGDFDWRSYLGTIRQMPLIQARFTYIIRVTLSFWTSISIKYICVKGSNYVAIDHPAPRDGRDCNA